MTCPSGRSSQRKECSRRMHKNNLLSRLLGGGCIWLILATYFLLLLSRLADASYLTRENEYLAVVLLQIMVFLIPAAVYCRIRGERYLGSFKMRIAGADRVPCMVCTLLVLASGCLLISLAMNGMQSLSGSFSLYEAFISKNNGTVGGIVYLILAYAALPAFCEEFVFRGVLSAEFEKYGVGVSIVLSSLFFALLHFSFVNLPVYFFAGLVLAVCYYATKSLFAVILVHFTYNLFGLFGQPYITAFYTYTGSTAMFVFLLVTVLLLSAALFCGQASRFYRGYADRNLPSAYHGEHGIRELPRRLFDAVVYPVTLLCFVLYLIGTILTF